MKIIVFKETAKRGRIENYFNVVEAFYNGIKKYNQDTVYHEGFEYIPCDVAVILGSWKDRKQTHHMLKKDVVNNHIGKIIIIETPLLGRTTEPEHIYWRIGIDHYMYGLADFGFIENQKSDRWNKLLNDPRIDIQLKPWKDDGDFVLLALQLPGDASLMGTDHFEWAPKIAHELNAISNKPIKIRPHPLTKPKHVDLLAKSLRKYNFIDPKITNSTIYDDIKKASCLVTFSSGSSIDAITAGTPVIALNKGCLSYPISGHSISDVNDPPKPDRMNHLYNLAYAQWSLEEMEEGLPWLHLRNNL